MMRRHKHDMVDCESWSRDRGKTLQWLQCECGLVNITMFKDADELSSMVAQWLRIGYTVCMSARAANYATTRGFA